MSNESPFFLSKVECPICKTINEYETVKVGSYYENGRDTDFCPLDIQWRYPRYQSYNPLVYFTATCSNCFYTREFSNTFKDWKNDNHFRTYRLKAVKEKHLDQLASAESVIRRMGSAVDLAHHPNKSGIIKLHLAIFDELLADRYNSLDLGRFYLRIAWIFRDLEKGENPHLQFLKGILIEIDGKFNSLRGATESSRQELDSFFRHLAAHFETDKMNAEMKAQLYPYRDKFNNYLAPVAGTFDTLSQQFDQLSALLTEYKSAALGGDSSSGESSFGQFRSFTDFLLDLRRHWDGAVTNEREALEKAVAYYKEAFAEGREISPGNQQIQASYLIAELSRRIGAYDDARQYFNATIKHGQEFIYQHRNDTSRTALARKILELAIEQGKMNMEALKSA